MKQLFAISLILIIFAIVGLFYVSSYKKNKIAQTTVQVQQSISKASAKPPEQEEYIEPEIIDLPEEPKEPQEDTGFEESKYLAGATPDETWKTFLQARENKVQSYDLDFYTDITKLIYTETEDRFPEDTEGPYKLFQKGDVAILYFENQKNPPVFLCKTEDGWKFDGFHQKKIVRAGWGVERYISPYSPFLRKFPTYYRIDIPLEEEDVYGIFKDNIITEKIKGLENIYKSGKMKYDEALVLSRLYSVNAMGLKAIPILEQLEEKMPDNADIYKYMAIAYVDTVYDYSKAYEKMLKYNELKPENEFGHNFLGYLLLKTENYNEAQKEFIKALEINPKSCYSYAKLSRLYKKADDKENFIKMFDKVKEHCTGENYERFIWLMQWIHEVSEK